MKLQHWRAWSLALLACASQTVAQTRTPPAVVRGNDIDGVPLQQIIEAVSARTGQTFVVDPQVNATIRAPGIKLQEVTFNDLQSILSVYGYTAVPVGSLFKIIPDANARQAPSPVIGDERRPNRASDEFVTKVLQPRRLSAAAVVTALRSLLPQQASITANPSSNSVIVVASAGDIEAIEILLLELEAAQ
jgi:general secretion pathway protein D